VAIVILVSIVAHGITGTPLSRRLLGHPSAQPAQTGVYADSAPGSGSSSERSTP